MNKHSLILAFAIVIICLTASCATIIHGSRQEVGITSNPASAKVTVDGQLMGKTPLITKLTRKESHIVKVEMEGYLPYETQFTRKVDVWIAGNIIFGGLIGLGVDALTGSMYKLTPDQVYAELRTNTASIHEIKDGIFFTVVLKPDPKWEKIGALERINN